MVPYCTSLEFQPDANPAMALADVQARLPGIRCARAVHSLRLGRRGVG